MRTKFKVGDRVERISGKHGGMKVGDTAIVLDYHYGEMVFLTKYGTYLHCVENLKKVSIDNWREILK